MNNEKILFKILKAVGHSKTIVEVAQSLYLSQPYISKVLRENETRYQVTLVTRKTHPIMLTNAGQTLLRDLQRVLSAQQQLRENLQIQQQADTKKLSVLINNPFMSTTTNQILTQYVLAHPTRRLNIRFVPTSSIADELINQMGDLSIGPRYNHKDLINQPLPSPNLYLFISERSPYYQPTARIVPLNTAIFRKLNAYHYIGFTDNSTVQEYINIILKNDGLHMGRYLAVPTPEDAVLAANQFKQATTFTTATIAATVLPRGNYNLMMLPQNFLSLSETATYLKTADKPILDLVAYLKSALKVMIQKSESGNV